MNGRPVKKIYPDGSSKRTHYDPTGRPERFTLPNGDQVQILYSAIGFATGKLWFVASDTNTPVKTTHYTYDLLGRITSWDDGTFRETFTYDDAGNAVTRTLDYGPFAKTVTVTRDEWGRSRHDIVFLALLMAGFLILNLHDLNDW